jgi:hypothetical protein
MLYCAQMWQVSLHNNALPKDFETWPVVLVALSSW